MRDYCKISHGVDRKRKVRRNKTRFRERGENIIQYVDKDTPFSDKDSNFNFNVLHTLKK